jgi:elongation factor G
MSSKRGQITGTDSARGMAVIGAKVPLSEVTSYQARLKSVTSGHGSYSLEFSHYEPVTPQIQQQLIAAYAKARKHEDDE